MTHTLVHDHRLMLFLLSNGASDEQGSIYALVLLVMARNATHAFPRGVFAPCVLLFLQTRFDLINSMSNLTIASLKHGLYLCLLTNLRLIKFNRPCQSFIINTVNNSTNQANWQLLQCHPIRCASTSKTRLFHLTGSTRAIPKAA